jgi:hypothetical protein
MEGDRKYRQRGYNDSDRPNSDNGTFKREAPRPQGPRPPLDVTGPRLPRMVQSVTASRCYSCSTLLSEGIDFKGQCPKCGAALHCCKQCAHFEPSTRFQCLKPIPVRIAVKDQANECELFKPRVTVARDVAHTSPAPSPINGSGSASLPEPRNATDARAAFDSLFRKPE